MSNTKIKEQVINKADKMIKWLDKEIGNNQAGIQAAEARIEAAKAEIERSKEEIAKRLETIQAFTADKAEWLQQKSELQEL